MSWKNRGQIWVETVIYTLIGLALIGLVLAIATPRINEFRDRAVIEQTIDSLTLLDKKVNEVLSAPGNVRVVNFEMRRGELYINASDEIVEYVIDDSRFLYSEPGVPISAGRINITTTEGQRRNTVSLLLNYGRHDLTFNDEQENVKFTATSVPYRFSIKNRGFQEIGMVNLDFSEVS